MTEIDLRNSVVKNKLLRRFSQKFWRLERILEKVKKAYIQLSKLLLKSTQGRNSKTDIVLVKLPTAVISLNLKSI